MDYAARRTPLSMGFSGQEYWSGLPCPPPGDLPDPGIEPSSPAAPALAGGFFTTRANSIQFSGLRASYVSSSILDIGTFHAACTSARSLHCALKVQFS